MNLFAISFRIHNDATYAERYSSVNDAILAQRHTTYWAEPTSFFLLDSTKNSAELATAINQTSKFAESKDLLIVINLNQRGYKVLGHYTDGDVDKLMTGRKLAA